MTENEYTPWTETDETDETDVAYWKRRFLEEVKMVEKLHKFLHEVASSDVRLEDERVGYVSEGYVSVQIDAVTWREIGEVADG